MQRRLLRLGGCSAMLGLLGSSMLTASPFTTERMNLAGEWRFALAAPDPSFPQQPLPQVAFADAIALPGTTETNNKGPENSARELGGLTRVRRFEGAAWYEREIEVPASWSGRQIELLLERTKYTQLWLDGEAVGEQRLFTAPQVYDLTHRLQPGRHRLTLMVDNRVERIPFTPNVHQFNSDNTQTNWNGVLGRIELIARPAVWLADVQVWPELASRSLRVRFTTQALAGVVAERSRVMVRATSFNHDGAPHQPAPVELEWSDAATRDHELTLPLGPAAKLWDEFEPALYRMTVTLKTAAGRDEREIETGLREFKGAGAHFTINGRPTFLRGRHEGGTFPLTGHPPMDVEGWIRYLRICRDYGLNHIRCHTWTPPEAAFAAADRLGIYLQAELPFWGTFDERVRDFLQPEADATLRAYGNHPSFVMLTLANEAGGDRGLMNAMVAQLRAQDSRRLYSDGCNNVLWDPRHQPTNEFWVTAKTRTPASGERQLPARGSFYFGDGYDGVVQWGEAQTRQDLSEAVTGLPVPVVGHEIGQYTVYPDFREIAKYTGVTQARNLEHFRDVLARRGRLEQANDFFRASGALTAELYREEIELALRTADFGGLQLLDLQDYPGQGTALVGMLDAFMDSKGLVTPERWREFCGPVVPLARFDRYAWTTNESYAADIQLAHYGRDDLRGVVTTWRLVDEAGKERARGEWRADVVTQGGLRSLGRVAVALKDCATPRRYDFVVEVTANPTLPSGERLRFANRWPLWVYPPQTELAPAAHVHVVRAFDAKAKRLLASGERVVLMPDAANRGYTLRGAYATDFWCWPMFNGTPGTMGLLINAAHPALAQFPTATHSERQWSRIAHGSAAVVLASVPEHFRPIVQVIDNLERNELLGLVFEARVETGSLLVVASDLLALSAAPEARQLWSSLLAYAGSPAFAPQQALSVAELDLCLRPSLALGRQATASSSFTPPWGFVPKPESAIDGDINTRWQAEPTDARPVLTIDLGRTCVLDTVELLWQHDEPGYRYLVEASSDGAHWQGLSDQRENAFAGGRHTLPVAPAAGARQVRVTITGWPAGRAAALRDVRVLGTPAAESAGTP
ncbi:coagulation factor 5/8 type domain protein [Opitutus terrae PB90-1]|uniref:Coagulation factor 5/8 type domain protein n=2 Tax=Opitutus terrae TaxID=107709 RepID=B1ZVU9_OPITP|nr:coagulation factor 5/8 type domain protein [Opitutus terrae PB90-1]